MQKNLNEIMHLGKNPILGKNTNANSRLKIHNSHFIYVYKIIYT